MYLFLSWGIPLTVIIISHFWEKVYWQNAQTFQSKIVQNVQPHKNRRATALGATAKRNPPRGRRRRCHHPQSGEELCSYEGGYTLPAKTLLPIMPQAQVLGRGSIQGLPRSPQSSVLRMPTATPHLLVRVRGGLTIGYLSEVAKPT